MRHIHSYSLPITLIRCRLRLSVADYAYLFPTSTLIPPAVALNSGA